MGLLVEGEWKDEWYDTKDSGGRFVRTDAKFREWTRDGGEHPPEAGRYHLYAAAACPWSHRVMLARVVFGLESALPLTLVGPLMLSKGWEFTPDDPDPLFGAKCLHEIYTRAEPRFTGRVTVPVLWDAQTGAIVSNESGDLLRMLDEDWRPLHTRPCPSWYPWGLRAEIDAINAWIYPSINNGVYRCGFATTQDAYDEAVRELFDALGRAEALLEGREYLVTDHPTEADWRLWVTLIRFDLVYHGHFKCNVRRIAEHPNLQAFMKRLYRVPGVAQTTDFAAIKTHYYRSHPSINPHGVVPAGPALDL